MAAHIVGFLGAHHDESAGFLARNPETSIRQPIDRRDVTIGRRSQTVPKNMNSDLD
jgi:hypothetical protein